MKKSRLVTVNVLVLTVGLMSMPLYASDAGAFIGGVFATKIFDNMQRRTQAEEVQAYNSSRSAARASSPAPSSGGSNQSTESKLQQLDKLAAGGYISPEEYKAKRKAILDSM